MCLVISSFTRLEDARSATAASKSMRMYCRETAWQRIRFSDTHPALFEMLKAFVSSQSDDSLTPNTVFREAIKSVSPCCPSLALF